MIDRGSLLQLALVAGTAALISVPAAAQQYKWDMPNEYGATSLPGMADMDFIRLVNEKSGGAIEITAHHGGSLGYKSRQHFTAVEDGAVPIASTYAGTFIGMDPVWKAQSIPFLATNPTESRAFFEAERPWLDKTFREAGGPNAYFGAPGEATPGEGRDTVSELGAILEDSVLQMLSAGLAS